MKATANSSDKNKTKIDNSAVTWPEQIDPAKFKRQYAHDWTADGLKQVTPRRKHVGPPAGQDDRRAVMYKGRTDQDKTPASTPATAAAPASVAAPADPAPTWGDVVAAMVRRELDATLAGLAGQVRATLARELAGALADQGADPVLNEMRARLGPDFSVAPLAYLDDQDAAPADQDAGQDQAPADQARARRTRQAKADQGADPAPAALPKPAHDMADYGRRADDRPKLTEKDRRQLRKQFAELDVFLNSEEMDDLDESKIDFGTHERKYVKIFLNGVHKGWSARRAHNFASKETYGPQAIIV